MRIWECDMCKNRLHEGEVIPLMEFDLCSDCVDRVKKFIIKGLEPTQVCIAPSEEDVKKLKNMLKSRPIGCYNVTVEQSEPRKTCNTCVHFLAEKSRCLKKKIQIHENDRDACLGWSDIKHCDNCKWSIAGRECYKERVYCGETGYCDQWES